MTRTRALVTGASRGIGAAIAHKLAADGFSVIINYRSNRAAAESVRDAITTAGGEATLCPFDIADTEASKAAIEGLLAEGPPITVLVNNAGVVADANFPSMQWEQWRDVTRTSLDGFYNVTHPLVMPMIRQKYGRIITLSSVSGLSGNKGQVNYSAAKAGLVGATRALAIELAKRKITVNAVAPGLIDTEMIGQMMEGVPEMIVKTMIPARRLGKPEEVAELVSFLASDRAAYITGQVIRIDGGLL
jgi:3-oxoacyl-[acyl-carrier protein] reductase